jgi:hypothetical protein
MPHPIDQHQESAMLVREWRTPRLEAILNAQELGALGRNIRHARKQMEYRWIIAHE